MSSNSHRTPSMFVEGVETFNDLKKKSGNVESLCKKSVRLENRLDKALRRYIKASLIALRAARNVARNLIPSFVDDSTLEDYLLQMVSGVFKEVVQEMDSPTPQDAE